MACRTPCPEHTVCPPDLDLRAGPALSQLFTETLERMRKDGQGLSLDQEMTIRRGLGIQ